MKIKQLFKSTHISFTKLFLELLVVFLGVSAGFLLQNNKEIKQNKEFERKYLNGFYNDVNENISELERLIEADSIWIENNSYAAKLILFDSLSFDSANALIIAMVYYSEFNPQTNTYATITNSGNLDLISNYKLRQSLVNCYKNFDEYELLDKYFLEHNSQNYIPFILNNVDLFNQKLIDPAGHKNILFKNIFAVHFSLTQQRIEAFKELLVENEALKVSLEKVLHDLE